MIENHVHKKIKAAALAAIAVHLLSRAGEILVAMDAAERYAFEVVAPVVLFIGHSIADAAPLIENGLLPPRPGAPRSPPNDGLHPEGVWAAMLLIGMAAQCALAALYLS